MIALDYYRLLPESQYINGVEIPENDCSFNPYAIFVLETRLYPLIYKIFEDVPIEITCQTKYSVEKKRMDLFLILKKLEDTRDPFIENNLIDMTKQQKEIIIQKIYDIKAIYPDYALIDINELYKSMNVNIPFSYFSSMLQYSGIDSYNAFIRPEGIYVTFNSTSDYKRIYYEISLFLVNRVKEFYEKGTILFGNLIDNNVKEQLIQDWKLVSIEEKEELAVPLQGQLQGQLQLQQSTIPLLYQPNWMDDRFAKNRVDFLLRKLQGDSYIRLKVSDNLVKRHGIARHLQKYKYPMVFEGSYLKVEAKNLFAAQQIASIVEYATGITNGKVFTLGVARLAEIYLYFDYAREKFGKGKSVAYSINNLETSYIFSCMIPNNLFSSIDELRYEFRDYAVQRLTDVTKVSKFKNMSPYSIIEEEYIK